MGEDEKGGNMSMKKEFDAMLCDKAARKDHIAQLSTDSDELRKRFMDPCRLGTEADWWAKRRIEELEREDAAWRKLNEQADKTVDRAEQERDALQADNARLREELGQAGFLLRHGKSKNDILFRECGERINKKLAATPEQSLARIRNQVREECASAFGDTVTGREAAKVVRAMKEPE